MNTNIKSHKRAYMIIALIISSVLAVGSIVLALGRTLAAPNDIDVTLNCESGVSGTYTIEVGQTLNLTVGNINQARNNNKALASIEFTTTGLNNFHITGLKAGVVTIAYGTKIGVVSADVYQITDANNISAYTIKDGGVVMLSGPGKTKSVPVVVTAGQDNIKWRSSNIAVATVNEDSGLITAVSNGMAIMIGEFTDKWGVERDIHILVGVGVSISGSNLEELINLIDQGGQIIGAYPNPYTPESLHDLQDAVNNGKAVLEMDDPTEEEIQKAIDDLKDALSNLEKLPSLPEVPTVTEDGRTLTPDQTGDTAAWIEIARNGDYSLIVRADFINVNANSKGDPGFQSPSFGANNIYQGSNVQLCINDWFNNRSTGDNLDTDARIRDFTVSNDALQKLGTVGSGNEGLTNGFSKPSGQVQSFGNDIAFALSFTEAANFISQHYAVTTSASYEDSSVAATANFNMLQNYSPAFNIWLRSPGTASNSAGSLQHSIGNTFQYLTSNGALVYPALWVNSAIFNG